MKNELWQLFDEQAVAINGAGETKQVVMRDGLLHGAAHVWMWRTQNGAIEVLVQRRIATKRTWANKLDISAAGHINLGEQPIEAACREAHEELGMTINVADLHAIGMVRMHTVAEEQAIEHEFQWIYLHETHQTPTMLESTEVASVEWMELDTFLVRSSADEFVPHGQAYYRLVYDAIMDRIESAS